MEQLLTRHHDKKTADLTAAFRLAAFRHQKFRVKLTVDPLLVAGRHVAYAELCRLLREYLIQKGLVGVDGTIRCDPLLKALTNQDSTNFFEIVRYFRSIVE